MTDVRKRTGVRRSNAALGAALVLGLAASVPVQATNDPVIRAPAQAPAGSTNDPTEPAAAPVIVCDEPVYNFGTVTNVTSVSHVFLLGNDGDTELKIERVRTTCGCTTAKLATKTIAPGEEVEVKTRLSLKGRRGHQNKSINVFSNDPENPRYRLTLKGRVHEDMTIRPRHVNFRVSPKNPKMQQEIVVTFDTGKPTHVTGIKTNEARFCTFALREAVAGKEYRIQTILTPAHFEKSDFKRGKIQLETDYPAKPLIDVPVSATYIRDVVVAPQQIFLVISTNSPAPISRPIIVKNRTATPAEIVVIDTPPAVNVTTQALSATVHKLTFTFENPSADLVGKEITLLIKRAPDHEYRFRLPLHVTFSPN